MHHLLYFSTNPLGILEELLWHSFAFLDATYTSNPSWSVAYLGSAGVHPLSAQIFSFLPPANEVWGKVMFLHLSVILFTVGFVFQHAMEQTPLPRILQDTVNKRAVRILLECILAIHLSVEMWSNYRLVSLFGVHVPIWEILDPPLGIIENSSHYFI